MCYFQLKWGNNSRTRGTRVEEGARLTAAPQLSRGRSRVLTWHYETVGNPPFPAERRKCSESVWSCPVQTCVNNTEITALVAQRESGWGIFTGAPRYSQGCSIGMMLLHSVAKTQAHHCRLTKPYNNVYRMLFVTVRAHYWDKVNDKELPTLTMRISLDALQRERSTRSARKDERCIIGFVSNKVKWEKVLMRHLGTAEMETCWAKTWRGQAEIYCTKRRSLRNWQVEQDEVARGKRFYCGTAVCS